MYTLSSLPQAHTLPCNRLEGCNRAAFTAVNACSRAKRLLRKERMPVQASLSQEALLAVTQQGLCFAAVAAGETYLSRQALREGMPGRPGIAPTAAAIGAIVVALGLTRVGDVGTQLGLVLGVGASIALTVGAGRRFVQTEDDPSDWPGPKVWPFTMVLLSFFAVNIFGQGLAQAF